jgi:hypothetical protein
MILRFYIYRIIFLKKLSSFIFEFFLLKSIGQTILLKSILFAMHHDHFVPDSSKFNCISDFKFVSEIFLKSVILILSHMPHYQPEFVYWIRFFFFRIFYFIRMIDPKIVIFEKTSRTNFRLTITRV